MSELIHVSVLADECIDGLNINPDGVYVDGTLGGAGHSSLICEKLSADGRLIGIDRDKYAIGRATERLEQYKDKVTLVNSNYSNVKNVLNELGIEEIDGMLLDLGVSSFQLDDADRGFSYRFSSPLDMRMSGGEGMSAKDVVNRYSEKELARILYEYGEERYSRQIAANICKKRAEKEIETTDELVEIIRSSMPAKALRDGHPAKRSFQAIRIEVNNELGVIEQTINDAISALKPGGRLVIITFHSLEDRIVKNAYAKAAQGCTCPREFPICVCGNKPKVKILTKKPILPSDEELEVNPRSASAKLRICEKL
ncbi:MAG: 16S rRNA (cytosine(1402)-N(4))-methyltransferase RsmH [Clostridia bacterium]|nr:16S rRNA (cytosine(1402)-N(4))-methyltransferase RsmH [Clostridia bacterium]MBQ4117338.1 16S rRNA (cytosine(1402)-N(4))-methyltransferase RsmH [Clostridia bacterium]